MFGKKILSIIGLLFIGCQISFVSADGCAPTYTSDSECTPADCDGTDADGYYAVGNKLVEITGSDSTASCSVVTTPGYYIDVDGAFHSVNYSKIRSDADDESDCTGNAGKFKTGGEAFCVADGKELTLGDSKKYLFTDSDTIFTSNVNNDVIVTSTAKSITVDKTSMNFIYNYCVDTNKVVRKRKEDLCDTENTGDCTYYKCDGTKCESNNINLVSNEERENGTCDFNNADSKCVNGGYYLYVTADDTKAPVENISATGPFTLVQCTSNPNWSCGEPATKPVGYLSNSGKGDDGNALYIKCEQNGTCTPVADIETGLKSLAVGTHLVSIDTADLLGIGQESSKFVVITRGDSSATASKIGNGYVTTTTSQFVIQNDTAGDLYSCTDETNYSKCSIISVSKPIGYIVNSGNVSNKPYIKCSVSGSCAAITVDSNCTPSSNDGNLYASDENEISICNVKNGDDDIILKGAQPATGEFFADVSTIGLFDIPTKTGYNIVLKFKNGNIVVDNSVTNRYRYTLSGKTKIYDKAAAQASNSEVGDICKIASGDNAYEYILANWDGAKTGLAESSTGIAYYVTEEYTK